MMVYYVTGVAVPRGVVDDLAKLPRTDLAKFFDPADAARHLERLRGPAYYDLRVEDSDEPGEPSP